MAFKISFRLPGECFRNSTVSLPCKSTLSVLNLNGQPLLTRRVKETKTFVDISTLPTGVYMVKVVGERGVQVGKVIKW